MEQANQKTYFSNEDMSQMFSLKSRGESETLRILESENAHQENENEFEDQIKNDLGETTLQKLGEIFGGLR